MKIKDQFPIFKDQPELVYLDSAATALKPKRVIEKEAEYYQKYSANVGRGLCQMAVRATEEYEKVRQTLTKFIGGNDEGEIVFTHGATEGLNLVAFGWGRANLRPGEEIILSEAEHHANLLPWLRLAGELGLDIKYMPVSEVDYEIEWEKLATMISRKTRVVALTQMSNVTGLANDLGQICKLAKRINPNLVVVVDGAQAVAHQQVKVAESGVDFFGFSAHKMYGPTGAGAVWAKKERWQETNPLIFGGGAVTDSDFESFELKEPPYKFEAGTPAVAQVIGMGEAVRFMEELGWENIEKRESEVASYAFEQLSRIGGMKIIGNRKSRVISFSLEGIHPHDLADYLGGEGICVRAGHQCALPLHKKLGLVATTRLSFGVYNTQADIDRAVKAIEELKVKFKL